MATVSVSAFVMTPKVTHDGKYVVICFGDGYVYISNDDAVAMAREILAQVEQPQQVAA